MQAPSNPKDALASTELSIVRTLRATRAQLWRAWSDPALLAQWWCPMPWTTEVKAFDFRPGGGFHTFLRGPDGGTSDNPGCFVDVVPQTRIAFTTGLVADWRPAHEPWLAITGSFDMRDAPGGGTLYTVCCLHANEATRDKHAQMGFAEGWGTCIDQLDALASKL